MDINRTDRYVVAGLSAVAMSMAGWIGTTLQENNNMTQHNQVSLSVNAAMLAETQKDIALIRKSQDEIQDETRTMSNKVVQLEYRVSTLEEQ